MNRYVLIDLDKLSISYLNKVCTDYVENIKYCGSENFTNYEELIKDLEDLISLIKERMILSGK